MERLVKPRRSDRHSLRAYLHVIFSAPETRLHSDVISIRGVDVGGTKQTSSPAGDVRAARSRRSASKRRAPGKVKP